MSDKGKPGTPNNISYTQKKNQTPVEISQFYKSLQESLLECKQFPI